jgi:hypothetical protein
MAFELALPSKGTILPFPMHAIYAPSIPQNPLASLKANRLAVYASFGFLRYCVANT